MKPIKAIPYLSVFLLLVFTACSVFREPIPVYATITPFPPGVNPFLVATGDSIAEGHGVPNAYHSVYHQGPSGDPNHEIWFKLSQIIPNLTYQNDAMGGSECSWVSHNAIQDVLKENSKIIIIHCGVNDVSLHRSWSDIELALNGVRKEVKDQVLIFDEILPWTKGTDEQAQTIRDWNSKLAAWTSQNNSVLIKCHDAMAQTRPSTGELDDLRTEYGDGSGVRLNNAGVEKMAEIIANSLVEKGLTPDKLK